jgi:hypothetical protein
MRKSLLLNIPILLLIFCCTVAQANALYMGFDKQIRDLRFDDGAQHLFDNKSMSQNTFSIGMVLTPALSVEGSYFQSPTTDTSKTLIAGEAYFGGIFGFSSQGLNTNSISVNTVNKIDTYNTARIYGFKLGIKETFPLGSGISLNGTLGLSRTTIRLSHIITRYYTADEAGTPNKNNQLNFSDTKIISSIGMGIDYAIISSLLLKANVLWEQTSKFNHIAPKQSNVRPGQSVVNTQNSVVYGIGINYRF